MRLRGSSGVWRAAQSQWLPTRELGVTSRAATTTAVGRSICWRLLDLSGAPMAVACGRDHSAAVSEDGALFVWGAGTRGQLGRGSKDDRHTPARLDEVGGPVMPSCPSLVLCVHH